MSDNIIQLNEDLIKHDLRDLVRSSVEETLNALLDHEAEELVNAEKYGRSGNRKGYRSGHYNRNFLTTAGDVTLKVPKLKVFSLKLLLSNGTAAENALLKKPLSRCTLPVFLFAVLRISQNLCGEPKCLPEPSVTLTKRPMNTLKLGVQDH